MWSKNLIISLIFILTWTDKVLCTGDDDIDMSCSTVDNCKMFQKENITVKCIGNECTCLDERESLVKCTPNVAQLIQSNLIGGSCVNRCNIENSDCDSLSKLCICKRDYIGSSDNLRCLKRVVQLGERCEDSSQCIKFDNNSECSNSTCVCQAKNFTLVDGACRQVLPIGSPCEKDAECSEHTANSKCVEDKRICVCIEEYAPTQQGTACLPSVGYGKNCQDNNQCIAGTGVGSLCDSGTCVCDTYHYKFYNAQTEKINCMKKIFPGDICTEHNDCYNGTSPSVMDCVSGECHCSANYTQEKRFCIEIRESSATSPILSLTLLVLIHIGLIMIVN